MKDRSVWSASNRAVYIEPSPTQRAEMSKSGPPEGTRIPYEHIVLIEERLHEHDSNREIRCFPVIGGYLLANTGSDATSLTGVVRSHVDKLVSERRKISYDSGNVQFVRRAIEPDGPTGWHLEDYDETVDATSDTFSSWVRLTVGVLDLECSR